MRSPNFPSRPSRRSVLIGGAAFGALTSMPRRARADQWPSRPVKLVVPFAAGGTTDILARVVAAKVSEEFGQQFIVENKAGAGGNIAADAVAKADPDGYTFIVGTPGIHAINQFVFKSMPYDQLKDIAPVIVIARVPNLCSVTNALPVKSVVELIAHAKSRPGELFYGTPGLGSTAHVSCELFKSMTGIEITHVPYKGSAPALTDLIAGRVHLMIDNLPAASRSPNPGRSVPSRFRPRRGGRYCRTFRPSPKPACPATRRRRGSPSARLRKRPMRLSSGSTPASTSFSNPTTASRACAGSAPSRPADRPTTCSVTCSPKPTSGARSPNSPASSRSEFGSKQDAIGTPYAGRNVAASSVRIGIGAGALTREARL
jgi:hypothetical protein